MAAVKHTPQDVAQQRITKAEGMRVPPMERVIIARAAITTRAAIEMRAPAKLPDDAKEREEFEKLFHMPSPNRCCIDRVGSREGDWAKRSEPASS